MAVARSARLTASVSGHACVNRSPIKEWDRANLREGINSSNRIARKNRRSSATGTQKPMKNGASVAASSSISGRRRHARRAAKPPRLPGWSTLTYRRARKSAQKIAVVSTCNTNSSGSGLWRDKPRATSSPYRTMLSAAQPHKTRRSARAEEPGCGSEKSRLYRC